MSDIDVTDKMIALSDQRRREALFVDCVTDRIVDALADGCGRCGRFDTPDEFRRAIRGAVGDALIANNQPAR